MIVVLTSAIVVSSACAERCGLKRLMDTRFSGIAKGVGTARILGRVHLTIIQVGQAHLPCTFVIIEDQSIDLIFGLDMLRRHQCVLDLSRNVLRIGEYESPFLSEKDIPAAFGEEEESHRAPSPILNPPARSAPNQAAGAFTGSSGQARVLAPIPEEKIQMIMGLGFTRGEAAEALRLTDGNVDLAASALFASRFPG